MDLDVVERVMKPGQNTRADLKAFLGSPADIVFNQGIETWFYNLSGDGYERLSFRFEEKGETLKSFLWIPRVTEQAGSMDYLKKRYDLSKHPSEEIRQSPSEALPSRLIFRNDNEGVVVSYDRSLNEVEGVARYEPGSRDPAQESMDGAKKPLPPASTLRSKR